MGNEIEILQMLELEGLKVNEIRKKNMKMIEVCEKMVLYYQGLARKNFEEIENKFCSTGKRMFDIEETIEAAEYLAYRIDSFQELKEYLEMLYKLIEKLKECKK